MTFHSSDAHPSSGLALPSAKSVTDAFEYRQIFTRCQPFLRGVP
jgi:hypothetical protein